MAADDPEEPVTPSLDDKATPSPPTRTTEQYEADCRAGVQRVGKPRDRKDK